MNAPNSIKALVCFLALLLMGACEEAPISLGPPILEVITPFNMGDSPKGIGTRETFVFKNNGDSKLKITDFELEPDDGIFIAGITNLPINIKPGKSIEVAITFRPTEEKTYEGQLVLDFNYDEKPGPITLKGRGVSNLVCLSCNPPPESECRLGGEVSVYYEAVSSTICGVEEGICSYLMLETLCENGPCEEETGLCYGQSVFDAGVAEPETDAGEPEADAGEPKTDAGEPETDAGEPETDAGEPAGCGENEFVLENTCTSCLSGTTNTAGDNPLGENTFCENIDECALQTHTCGSNTNCVDTDGAYRCDCMAGYETTTQTTTDVGSESCEDIDGCNGQICSGHGTCTDVVAPGTGYNCTCNTGWAGDDCNTNINECSDDTNTCGENTDCLNTEDSFQCDCKAGHETVAQTTTNVGSENCEDINGCDGQTCSEHGSCEDVTAPNTGHHCICNTGWDGADCNININECDENTHTCGNNTECTDTDGSYHCDCATGYQTAAQDTANVGSAHCDVNINECDENTDTCGNNTECVDTDGSFHCDCATGYQTTAQTAANVGNAHCDVNINECDENTDTCGNNTECVDTDGSFHCDCATGYQTTAQTTANVGNAHCDTNINECTENSDTCGNNTECVDTDGSYHCDCMTGYETATDTTTSVGSDDCSDDIDGCSGQSCSGHGACEDVAAPGTDYLCVCDSGWGGDNCDSPPTGGLMIGVRAVAAGNYNSYVVLGDGSLWGAGANYGHQLGIGSGRSDDFEKEFIQIVDPSGSNEWDHEVFTVAAGESRAFFVTDGATGVGASSVNGALWAMGLSEDGQLGNGDAPNGYVKVSLPQKIVDPIGARPWDGKSVIAISASKGQTAGAGHTFFINEGLELWGMGTNSSGKLGISETDDDDDIWDAYHPDNGGGYFGNNTNRATSHPILIDTNVVAAAAGPDHSLYVKGDGSLWGMGENLGGQMGLGTLDTVDYYFQPVQILSSGVASVAVGLTHSLFLKTDGSVWGMGENRNGELGTGCVEDDTSCEWIDVPVEIIDNSVGANFIAACEGSSFVSMNDGRLWAFGHQINYSDNWDHSGQLGIERVITSATHLDGEGGCVFDGSGANCSPIQISTWPYPHDMNDGYVPEIHSVYSAANQERDDSWNAKYPISIIDDYTIQLEPFEITNGDTCFNLYDPSSGSNPGEGSPTEPCLSLPNVANGSYNDDDSTGNDYQEGLIFMLEQIVPSRVAGFPAGSGNDIADTLNPNFAPGATTELVNSLVSSKIRFVPIAAGHENTIFSTHIFIPPNNYMYYLWIMGSNENGELGLGNKVRKGTPQLNDLRCEQDHYVSDIECLPCTEGTQNEAGDPLWGENTTCN